MINEGTDKHSPEWLLKLKSTIRPFLTYYFAILYGYVFVKHNDFDDIYIENLNYIMLVIIIWWFSDRLLKNAKIPELINNIVLKGSNTSEIKSKG